MQLPSGQIIGGCDKGGLRYRGIDCLPAKGQRMDEVQKLRIGTLKSYKIHVYIVVIPTSGYLRDAPYAHSTIHNQYFISIQITYRFTRHS